MDEVINTSILGLSWSLPETIVVVGSFAPLWTIYNVEEDSSGVRNPNFGKIGRRLILVKTALYKRILWKKVEGT